MSKGTGIAVGLIIALGLLGVQIHCAGGKSDSGSTTGAPSITAQPQSLTVVAQTATVTSPVSATFSVTATGSPAPSYQWYLNGSAIPGADDNYYTTYATAVGNSGDSYTVAVSNGVGNPVVSQAAILTVDAAPVITSQRNAVAATSGDPATFSVTVTGNPAPSFQWYVSGVPIPGAASASYTTAACTPDMNGENYTITASNSLGSVSSLPIVLTVYCCPIFTAQPASVTVNAGVAATFTAAATGTPAPAYQWYLGGSAIPGATSVSYTTAAATADMNGGSYSVTATNASGSATSSPAILTVNAAGPVITGQPASATVTVPATATFTVTATGTPAPTYQWYLGGTAIAGATSASYTTAATTLAMNGGSYTATATNALGSVTSSAAILTVDAAPAITAQPASVTVGAGAAATFTVTATGNPAPTYQWNLGGTAIAGATATSYTTAATTQDMNGGSYTVTVTNALGSVTSSAAVLTVNTSPAITTQPASVTVNAGAAATFRVVATGQPAPTYAWSLNGSAIAGATAASYTTAATTSAMDQGSYTVTVTNTFGSVTSSPAILTVDYAPTITTQPASATVTAGATATFTVVAAGEPAPTYQWNLGGTAISGATSASYTTPTTTSAMNGGSYTVTVTDSQGSLTSSAAILTVNSSPTITTQPAGVTVNAGATATFTAAATGNPAPTYQWNLGGSAISGANSASYTTPTTTSAMNGGSYTVTVTNSLGSLTSSAAILTVDYAPAITTQPAAVTVNAGATATFTVAATGNPAPTYQWNLGGSAIPGASSASYTTPTTTSAMDQGSYTVTVTNSLGSITSSAAILTVNSSPTITTQPAAVTVNAGATATFTVAATGNPTPTYQWNLGGSAIAGASSASYTTPTTTSAMNGGSYTVTVTNSQGSITSSAAILTVDYAPTITTQPASVTVNAGATATFTVVAAGEPAPTYQWNLGGTAISGATSASYTTPTTTSAMNGGSYTVTVTNSLGSLTSSAAILTVDYAPAITTQPAAVTVGAGATATFTVAATGDPTPTYQWNLGINPISGATSASYTTPATTSDMDQGSYTVTVTNSQGSVTSAAAVLTVDFAPIITTQPASVTVNAGDTATFTVVATGDPTPTYQWSLGINPIPGATSASYTTPATTTDMDQGSYTVLVTNTQGSVTSSPAILGVNAGSDSSPDLGIFLSDAATEDWATIGVKVLTIALIPQGGTAAAASTVYTAATPAPVTNLANLDNMGELLGNAAVPPGTYTGAVLNLGANPGDVVLVSSSSPSASFAGTPATTVPPGQIQIQGAAGSAGSLTVPVTVNFPSSLVVGAGPSAPLDLEFDLSHPAFIVDHLAAGDAAPIWAVNFNGPVSSRQAAATGLVLGHLYGTATAVAPNASALTVTKDVPAWPVTSPETAQPTSGNLTILADASNGTLFWDLDAQTTSTLKDFSSVAAGLPGRFLRIAARYQADGSLVAARIWASSTFATLYAGPEGHLLHVDAASGLLMVEDPTGIGVPVQVTPATQFFFRNPADAVADGSAVGTGIAFLGTSLVRGFKVHVSADPTTTPMTALSLDIETARFDGAVTASGSSGLTYTRAFTTAADDYTVNLGYSSAAAAGSTPPSFLSGGAGPVSFGGTVPDLVPWGVSYAVWNDPAAPAAWAAQSTLPQPALLPLGTVASPWSGADGSFGLALPGSANAVAVSLDVSAGSATLVYRVDRTGNRVTLTPVDITTAAGQAVLAGALVSGEVVRVYGVPQNGDQIMAKALLYYAGTLPAVSSAASAPAS